MGNVQSEVELNKLLMCRDGVSGTYDAVMTFVIGNFLPKHIIQTIVDRRKMDFVRGLLDLKTQDMNMNNEPLSRFGSGSKFEGLSLPQMHIVSEDGIVATESADDDLLAIGEIYVYNSLQKAIENNGDLYLDTSQTKPGFARIKSVETNSHYGDLLVSRTQNGERVWFMSKQIVQQLKSDKTAKGPAAAKTFDINISRGEEALPLPGKSSMDLVYAIKLKEWPDFMKAWQSRQHEHSNLSENIPCLLVGAAHPLSQDPEIEWRISCSIPELILARKLTVVHRQVYMTFKYLVKEITKGQKGIMTYHLKTTLLWTIERTPPNIWHEDNLAQCLYQLFDNFINFLSQRQLPNYFNPESNLFEHLSSDHMKTTVSDLMKLRQDPVGYLLKFQRRIRLTGHSISWDHSLEDILLPHLQKASDILTTDPDDLGRLTNLRHCLFDATADLVASLLSEHGFPNTYEMMMAHLNLASLVRCGAEVPFEECFYSLLKEVCIKCWLCTGDVQLCVSFVNHLHKCMEEEGKITNGLTDRFNSFKAWLGMLFYKQNHLRQDPGVVEAEFPETINLEVNGDQVTVNWKRPLQKRPDEPRLIQFPYLNEPIEIKTQSKTKEVTFSSRGTSTTFDFDDTFQDIEDLMAL